MWGRAWPRRWPALVLLLCFVAIEGQNIAELGSAASSTEVIGSGRRVSVADVESGALYSASAYAFTYGTPEASSVPLVLGFHTASLAAYGSSQRSKLRLTVASGIDFSGFSIRDVQDIVNLPPITWLEANPTQVQFFFEQEALKADTEYELTVRATTTSAGTLLGSIGISWYSYNHATRQWVMLEESTVRQGHGNPLHHDSVAVKTSANSFAGSSVVAAWTSGSSPASVLVELKMQALVAGIVSLMPFPPSAWNFSSLGGSITDGMVCPSGNAQGSALSVQVPSSAAHCFLRKRGQQVNSVDIWFLAVDLSKGASVKLTLPRPLVGTLNTWYVSYREWGSSPGHLVSALPLAGSALQLLGPRPHVAVEGCTSTYPGRSSVLRISFGFGTNLLDVGSAFLEFRLDTSAFRIEQDGCGFGDSDSKPLGSILQTSTTANACNMSWSSSQSGTAFWSHVYTMSVAGTNVVSNTTLTATVEMVLFSGQDANSDGRPDFWTARYQGDGCRIQPPPALPLIMLYPTTVAENTKARVLLSFQTGSSTRFSGEADEYMAQGMVLRLYTDYASTIQLHKADGTNFQTSATEAMGVDCSTWVLELKGDGDSGFPHPSHCWWDDWSQARPSVYMRFRPRNGLRLRQTYDMVFLATLALAANGLPDLLTLELRDGDGATYLNQGSAGLSGTVVTRPIRGSSDEPTVTSLEIVGGEPLAGGEIAFRAHGGSERGNEIVANSLLRLFLFPLTAWHATSCAARRSDGSLVACAPERVGRRASALLLTLDQNSLPVGNDTDVLFTVSGVPAPAGGFFRGELGVEVWHHPRESARYMASYVSSAEGRLGSNNFASAPVGGGAGHVAAHERRFAEDAGGGVHVVYRPAATCISTAAVPCRLSLTVPDGFLALSLAAANSAPGHASLSGTEAAPLSPASGCELRQRRCLLEMRSGSTLWAGARYSFTVLVSNPVSPLAQDVPWNAWIVQLSGAERWGLARRTEGRPATLGRAFPVLGRLRSAAVQPSALTCGARVHLRVQFATLQSVPSDGSVTVTAPPGFGWQESGAGRCYTFEHAGWPGSAACTVAGGTVSLTPAAPLGARSFYAFSLAARLPAAPGGGGRFSIATATATSALDAAPEVSWSAQARASGDLVFPELFDCYPRALHTLRVSVDDLRPYLATRAPATATLLFQLGGPGVPGSPVGVDVYAPAGYRWQAAGFESRPGIPAVAAAPLLLSPEWLSASHSHDANVLSLLTAAQLEGQVLYGFTARVQVPSATPGTPSNPTSGDGWYITVGTGRFGEDKHAAARAVVQQPQVRAISGFALRRGTAAALATGILSAAFTTVTPLPRGGLLRLELPAGFDFGGHLGQSCSADALWSQGTGGSEATPLPADAAMACRAAAGGVAAAFEWLAGAGGLPAGRYEASVFLRNPSASAEGRAAARSSFVLQSFLDGAGAVADAAASAQLEGAGGGLQQAELVLAYVDARAGIFDPHPGAATWVAFAFELAGEVEPDFAVDIRAPEGFAFPSTCEVHIGDGSTYSPLGDSLTVLPPHVTRYVLFPPGTSATCLGHRREARILVSPTVPGSRASFPAVPGRLYLFRVRVTNPQSVPAVNKWLLRVAGQEYGDIAGYDLWEFRAVSARPSYAAAGVDNTVALRFWSRSAIPGRPGVNSMQHGLLSVRMPEGFHLRTAGAACLGFTGLRNESGGALPAEISCEAWPGDERRLALHNRMMEPLPAGQYEFSFAVRNPMFPMEALHWQLASYGQQTAQASTLLDFKEAKGFAVSAPFRSFNVEPEPAGQQSAGAPATLHFRLIPASEVLRGDALMVYGPDEYNFECASGFASVLLPPPTCSGNRVIFSFLEANASVLPRLVPFGLEGATVLTFQLGIRNPMVKPARNVLEFLHCRGASMDISPSDTAGCPAGAQTVAAVQHQLWQIVPRIQGMQVSLLSPTIAAQGKSSHVVLRFTGASTGAVTVRVQCPGMNFMGCLAESGGAQLLAVGRFGSADVRLPAGRELPAGQPFELRLRRVLNPAAPGPTAWAVTTLDAAGAIVDQAAGHAGYAVLRSLELEPLAACQPQRLLSPEVPEAQKRLCTARYPWYEHGGNLVTLRFRGLSGGEVMSGHRLLVQPPAGYAFPARGGAPLVVPLGGLSGSDGDGLGHALVAASSLGLDDARFAGQALSVRLASGLAMPGPFSLQVRVDNPARDPASNYWRFTLLAPDGTPMYTNDGAWPGFALHGTFFTIGHLSAVQWLVSDFPSEPNVIRLQVSLASPLAGQALRLKVTAPQGFIFDTYCLPAQPDLLPQPGLTDGSTITVPWVTGCTAERSNRNSAMLEIATNLAKRTPYAVNLLITNAAVFQATALWELCTFRDNDLVHFVHYTALSPFPLRIMEAAVLPEIRRYEASSLLHVSLRPQRDLGPHGQVIVSAPEGYRLFCRLRPYFSRGNMPSGVGCSGANNYAVVQLSGGDALERGMQYQFAVRVTNPSATAFGQMSSQAGGVPTWSVRLQTRERDLVHETTQVAGYAPASKAIARFAVATSTGAPGAVARVQVQFKLETQLVRWRGNRLELAAPSGFLFTCAEELVRNSYVLPTNAIFSSSLPRFQDLLPFLELPPARGSGGYRNEGTTEDGRAIVDCSRASFVSLAVDSTDSFSFGRYAFQVEVRNPQELPVPNVWMLRSYEEGSLLEEGAAGGYTLTTAPTVQPAQRANVAPSSGSWRILDAKFQYTALIGICLALTLP